MNDPLTPAEVRELARLFDRPDDARRLLAEAGLDAGLHPAYGITTSADFWQEIANLLVVEPRYGLRRSILASALSHYPDNPVFRNGRDRAAVPGATARGSRRATLGPPAPTPELGRACDSLARAVRRLRIPASEFRQLHGQAPLTVRWTTATTEKLAVSWDSIARLATADHVPGRLGLAADSAAGLDGGSEEIGDLLFRVPTRRLVIVGAPGSGKSVLLLRLVERLLGARGAGEPVPVPVRAVSWNPEEQHLHAWLAERLVDDYPGLARAVVDDIGGQNRTLAAELIEERCIVPILDGLDEIPANHRKDIIDQLNRALRPGDGIVVSSRAAAYEELISFAPGSGVRLAGGAVVEIEPLTTEDVITYLGDAAEIMNTESTFLPVLHALGHRRAPRTREALSTPLMVRMFASGFRDGGDPGQLEALSSPTEIQVRLLGRFLTSVYPSRPTKGVPALRWPRARTTQWLQYFAGLDSAEVAWWHLHEQVPPRLLRNVAFLAGAVPVLITTAIGEGAVILAGAPIDERIALPLSGFCIALLAGLVCARSSRRSRLAPSRAVRARPRLALVLGGAMLGFAVSAVAYLPLLLIGSAPSFWPYTGGVAILFVVASIARGATRDTPLDAALGPRDTLRTDRTNTTVRALAFGVGTGVAALLAPAPIVSRPTWAAIAGVFFAALLVGTLTTGAWWQFTHARVALVIGRSAPVRLMAFLEDALEREVLQQSGAVFVFRHELLRQAVLGAVSPEETRELAGG